jgi:excinuclease UvrABC nuclease subunit
MCRKLPPVKSQTTHIYSHYLPKISAGIKKKTYYVKTSVLHYISAVLKTKYCTKVSTSLDYLRHPAPKNSTNERSVARVYGPFQSVDTVIHNIPSILHFYRHTALHICAKMECEDTERYCLLLETGLVTARMKMIKKT